MKKLILLLVAPLFVFTAQAQTVSRSYVAPSSVTIDGVGNYGEVFERNVGKSTALKLDRGLNALWTNGGVLYAPPVK